MADDLLIPVDSETPVESAELLEVEPGEVLRIRLHNRLETLTSLHI